MTLARKKVGRLYFSIGRSRKVLAATVALIESQDFVSADAMLEPLLRHRQDTEVLRLHAISAHNSARYGEAYARWERLRAIDATLSEAWGGMAANAREMKQLDLARSIIDQACARFPTDVVLMTEALRISDAQQRHEEAEVWMDLLVTAIPQNPDWWLGHIAHLMAHGDLEIAVGVARRALPHHPRNRTLTVRLITCLKDLGRFEEVLFELQRYRESMAHDSGHAGLIETVIELFTPAASFVQWLLWHAINAGRYELAEDIAKSAASRFPGDLALRFERVRLAFVQEHWAQVVAILDADGEVGSLELRERDMLGFARMNLRSDNRAAHPRTPDAIAAVGVDVSDQSRATLLRGFESLGVDCEFGLVQRHFGLEPLGLTRWMGVTAEVLANMIDCDFADLGSEETSILTQRTSGEYFFTDTRFAFEYHTWMFDHEVDRDDLLKRTRRHVSFLKRLFLDEIRKPTRVMVLKTFAEDLSQVKRLHAALRRHGPVTMLWVRSAVFEPSLARSGATVTETDPGLFAAGLSAFGNAAPDWQIHFDEWIEICRKTRELIDARLVENHERTS